ncbi:MAG: hypothetical protein IK093_09770 [Ruminiclostridium sp.]|nr:hypothetical protein [Ruminiclostridium sp.]
MTDEKTVILAELKRIEAMLYKNEQLFDLTADSADTEALIYEHRALEVRRSALYARAKELGIREECICGRQGRYV